MSLAACKLLIVDDEYWVREKISGMLRAQELPISLLEPAADGEDALRRIESERPDILITDINMPFINGNELIKTVKKRYPQMPVIVLSGYSDFVLVREALLSGAMDYLLKPITQSALLDVLDKAISVLNAARAQESELVEMRKKLAMASSILRDEAMSALIMEDVPDAAPKGGTADLELQFAAFTLILVKLTDMPRLLRKNASRVPDMLRLVKEILRGRAGAGNAVAFHNNYVRNEFILLTDLNDTEITRLCRDLPGKLERCTGSRVSMAVSGLYGSFDRLRSAYAEARAALFTRPLDAGGVPIRVEDSRRRPVSNRFSAEMEKRLAFALQSGNRKLAREVIFDQSGLRGCGRDGWLLIEVKQTAEYIAGMIIHHAANGASSGSIFSMENVADLLGTALESEDVPEVCAVIEQLLEEAFGEPGLTGVSDSMQQSVRRVREYVESNYFEELSLTSLAKLFRIDRAYLSKAFKMVTGHNLMSAIAKRRIDRAAQYIREEDLSLTEISSLVGYDEYAYFNRVFRKIMGISPSEYRARGGTQ